MPRWSKGSHGVPAVDRSQRSVLLASEPTLFPVPNVTDPTYSELSSSILVCSEKVGDRMGHYEAASSLIVKQRYATTLSS